VKRASQSFAEKKLKTGETDVPIFGENFLII
jgi:hypothetical protein